MPWTPSLSVGVETIDQQHKTWFEKAEALFEAGKRNEGAAYIKEMFTFLEDYTKKHFADEEAYMLRIRYPGYAEQKSAHTAFIQQLEKVRNEFNASGGNILTILNANQLVINWLTQHISNLDKKIGLYAKTLAK